MNRSAKLGIFVLCFFLFSQFQAQAERKIVGGERSVSRNRLISTLSPTGKRMYHVQEARSSVYKDFVLDGQAGEEFWASAQPVGPFLEGSGKARPNCRALVAYDKENLYLFWDTETPGAPRAAVTRADTALDGDDYLQVDFYPVLPDSFFYGRGYHYSLAANPLGTVWDAYYDPYREGFFFTSWNSRARVVTVKRERGWSGEMVIPFSGLDLFSDPGWSWMLEFYSSNGEVASAVSGIRVTQGVLVRRPGWVSYYWDRPELMPEIQPNASTMFNQSKSVAAARAPMAPKLDGRLEEACFAGAAEGVISLRDDTAEPIARGGASFKVTNDDKHLYFLLKAIGGKVKKGKEGAEREGSGGMAAQMAGVNGVFRDQALLSKEGFWIMLQPRVPGKDAVHQECYFVTLDNQGLVKGIYYDGEGIPDRSWDPQARLDLFDTPEGWGAELILPVSAFYLPVGCGSSWGLNVVRNCVATSSEAGEVQSWCPNRGHQESPAHLGRLTGLGLNLDGEIRASLGQRAVRLEEELKQLEQPYQNRAREISRDLGSLKKVLGSEDVQRSDERLEAIEQRVGQVKALQVAAGQPATSVTGYRLQDIFMLESSNLGWAVGRMGVILHTEDGGRTWSSQSSGTNADLMRVWFADEREGWIVGGRIRMGKTNETMRHDQRGGYAYILHTTDSGRTWEIQYAEQGRHLFGLSFLDKQRGWVCGERGFLMKTMDGGRTWRKTSNSGTIRWLNDIEFLNPAKGFAVGEAQLVLVTEDGGMTWAEVEAPADKDFYGFVPHYRAVTFRGRCGWIVGQNGTILGTTDEGRTWRVQTEAFSDKVREMLDLENVCFADQNRGWAVGRLGTRIMATENGGASWRLLPLPNRTNLHGVWLDSRGRGAVAADQGKIMTTTDWGGSWVTAHGGEAKLDILALMAHGDDGPLSVGTAYVYYSQVENRRVGDIQIIRDAHSVEYQGETYNLEHHRSANLMGCQVADYLDECENGNNGSDYYHFNQRMWENEGPMIRRLAALIRTYRPEVVITHGDIFGDYDKPGHKLAGRATFAAFESVGGKTDQWPELTRLGLTPWQPKKLYCLDSESYPETLDLSRLMRLPVGQSGLSIRDWGNWAIRCFQSQGVYHAGSVHLHLVKSLVPVPETESSIFDGLEQ